MSVAAGSGREAVHEQASAPEAGWGGDRDVRGDAPACDSVAGSSPSVHLHQPKPPLRSSAHSPGQRNQRKENTQHPAPSRPPGLGSPGRLSQPPARAAQQPSLRRSGTYLKTGTIRGYPLSISRVTFGRAAADRSRRDLPATLPPTPQGCADARAEGRPGATTSRHLLQQSRPHGVFGCPPGTGRRKRNSYDRKTQRPQRKAPKLSAYARQWPDI